MLIINAYNINDKIIYEIIIIINNTNKQTNLPHVDNDDFFIIIKIINKNN